MNGKIRGKRALSFPVLAWLLASTVGRVTAADTTAAAFLRIDTGARPAALGGAYTGIADDIHALRYNPGGLPLMNKRELGATHAKWVLDSDFDFLAYAHPTSLGTLGLSLTRLSSGRQDIRTETGQAAGSFDATDSAYSIGFGRSLGNLLPGGRSGLGANIKYIQSRIGSDSASAFALDLGMVHRFDKKPLSLGVSVLNLGRGMRFITQRDPLPLTLSVGGAHHLAGLINVALDVRHEPNAKTTDIGIGTEYAVLSSLTLRAGYTSLAPTGTTSSALSGLGGGFRLNLYNFRAEYAFTPFGSLGNAQRISLGARF